MPWTTERKIFIVEAYFQQKSIHAAQLQFKERFGCREFPVHSMIYRWINKFRTLCITSIVKTLTDNHFLDDRNHQGHHTTSLLSETVLSTAQASPCVGEVRSLESTPSERSRCLASSGQHLVDGEGSSGSFSGSSRMVPPTTPHTNHGHGYSSVSLSD